MQNDISKHCTKFQKCSSKITKVTKSQSFHKCFLGVLGFFQGVRVIRFLPKFRIPCRMILVNTVPNSKGVAPKLQKLQSRKVPINVGRTTTNDDERHQSGKNYSLAKMKFCRVNNDVLNQFTLKNRRVFRCKTTLNCSHWVPLIKESLKVMKGGENQTKNAIGMTKHYENS